MRSVAVAAIILSTSIISFSQENAQKIYDTERAFEKMVAEKGIRDGFIEFLSPQGVIFTPEAVNARESWRSRPPSPAALTWNPVKIGVSSNGALGYAIGNSIYRPKGKDDPDEFHGHYLSVWTRQPNGDYRAALDTGINHDKPSRIEPDWKPSATVAAGSNPRNTYAGDSSIGFYRLAESRGLAKAYKAYAAEDIYLLRDGKMPFVGRSAAIAFLSKEKAGIKFVKRRSFIEAGDLAFVYSNYSVTDKAGSETGKGVFVQVWKLNNGKWQIVADLFRELPQSKD